MATAGVVDALSAVLATNACAVGVELGSVTVADGCATVATTCPALMVAVGVVALTVADCAEFDSVSSGFDVVCSVCGAGVAGGVLGSVGSPEPACSLGAGGVSTALVSSSGSVLVGVGAVDVPDSVVLVCAPPLLLMVTPDATSVDDDVDPDVCDVSDVPRSVDVEPVRVDAESASVVAVDEVAVPVVDVAADPVVESPEDVSLDVELAELVDDGSEDVAVVSAAAKPGEAIAIAPIPRAAANAPTRPT